MRRDLANNLATPRLCRDRQNGFPARKGGKSETGRKPQVMASFPSHTRLSGGGDMGRRKRRRVDPTDDWQQLELLCVWEEQREYERIRPLVLFGGPVPGGRRRPGSRKGCSTAR